MPDLNTTEAVDAASVELRTINATLAQILARQDKIDSRLVVVEGGTVPSPPAGPVDLTVTSVALTPATPIEGQPVVFSATIKNVGLATKPSTEPVVVDFVVDGDGNTATFALLVNRALATNESVTVAVDGGPHGGAAWEAVKGAHTVVATVRDSRSGSAPVDTTNSGSATFTVGGPNLTNPPTPPTGGFDSNGFAVSNLVIDVFEVTDQQLVQANVAVQFDPNRSVHETVEIGFSVRKVDAGNNVVSADDTGLDLSTTPFESTATWAGRQRLHGARRQLPAGRYQITPFYRVRGTQTWVKSFGKTEYVTVTQTAGQPGPVSPTWKSGISAEGEEQKQYFRDWLGRDVRRAVTTHYSPNTISADAYSPGSAYGGHTGDMIGMWGALTSSDTWAGAAGGVYDSRWTAQLTNARTAWNSVPGRGQYIIVFAHEFNASWHPWRVPAGQAANFKAALKRFRNLQKSIWPQAKLALSLNRESVRQAEGGFTPEDWRNCIPGHADSDVTTDWLDFGGLNYYNQCPALWSRAQFVAHSLETDFLGHPKGIETHRSFWQGRGVPVIVPEWANSADSGDAVAFVEAMRDYFQKHAGTGAGKISHEVYYGALAANRGHAFLLRHADRETRQPKVAEKYRVLFGTLT